MLRFLNETTDENPKVMLTEADVKKLKHGHGVVLFFMNGCGHCKDMKDDWNAAVDECRSSGIGNDNDDFILGAVESGNTDMFQKHGINTNVNGYPTILYIRPEDNGNHEKYQNMRKKENFVEWIKDKKKKKSGNKAKKQSGGGKRRSYRRKYTRKTKSKTKSKKYVNRHTRSHRHRHRHMKGGSCGCGSSSLFSINK